MNLTNNTIIRHAYSAGDDVVGTITVPGGIPTEVGSTGNFISAIIKLVMVVGGIFTLWQFLTGGLLFITSGGDKGKIAEAQQKFQMSLIGIVAMTGSFIIIAIVSQVLFGSPTKILNPEITTVSGN